MKNVTYRNFENAYDRRLNIRNNEREHAIM